MAHHWDEFSKSLVEKSVPRRETLRLLGAALAGVFLSPLGLKSVAAASPDACSAFCRCSNKRQQNRCLAACRACNGDTSRLCGSCATGFACTDLASDPSNCGACGNVCRPGPLEDAACFDGTCVYLCAEGAVRCGGTCTLLEWDPDNCGACGNACPEAAPYCTQGVCSACQPGLVLCGDSCVDLESNPDNCGACGNVCGGSAPYCSQGECVECPLPYIACNGVCVNPLSDSSNCGACGNVCPPDFYYCSNGACWDPVCQFVEC
jgi:Stigma-specific protein, Stig1